MQITIVEIPADKYPAFMKDPDHPCLGLSDEARIADFDACLANLWARACLDRKAVPETREIPIGERKSAAA